LQFYDWKDLINPTAKSISRIVIDFNRAIGLPQKIGHVVHVFLDGKDRAGMYQILESDWVMHLGWRYSFIDNLTHRIIFTKAENISRDLPNLYKINLFHDV
jgi:hypothetical protein